VSGWALVVGHWALVSGGHRLRNARRPTGFSFAPLGLRSLSTRRPWAYAPRLRSSGPSGLRRRIARGRGLPIADFGMRISDCGFRNADCRLPFGGLLSALSATSTGSGQAVSGQASSRQARSGKRRRRQDETAGQSSQVSHILKGLHLTQARCSC